MQRISVDLPVPDGADDGGHAATFDCRAKRRASTGWPARYSLRRLRMTSDAVRRSGVGRARPWLSAVSVHGARVRRRGHCFVGAGCSACLGAGLGLALGFASYAALLNGVPVFSAISRTTFQCF